MPRTTNPTAGGILRVFGRGLAWSSADVCTSGATTPLAPAPTTILNIRSAGSDHDTPEMQRYTNVASSIAASCYEASFVLPGDLAAVTHTFTLATPWGVSTPFVVSIRERPSTAPPIVIDVAKDYNGDIVKALAAAERMIPPPPGGITVRLAADSYNLTQPLVIPNFTAVVGVRAATTASNEGGMSVLSFALPQSVAKACYPAPGRPTNPGRRCDDGGFGCDCSVAAVYGPGAGWGAHSPSPQHRCNHIACLFSLRARFHSLEAPCKIGSSLSFPILCHGELPSSPSSVVYSVSMERPTCRRGRHALPIFCMRLM